MTSIHIHTHAHKTCDIVYWIEWIDFFSILLFIVYIEMKKKFSFLIHLTLLLIQDYYYYYYQYWLYLMAELIFFLFMFLFLNFFLVSCLIWCALCCTLYLGKKKINPQMKMKMTRIFFCFVLFLVFEIFQNSFL